MAHRNPMRCDAYDRLLAVIRVIRVIRGLILDFDVALHESDLQRGHSHAILILVSLTSFMLYERSVGLQERQHHDAISV